MVGFHLVRGAIFAILSADALAIVAVFIGGRVDAVNEKVLPLNHQTLFAADWSGMVVVPVHEVEYSGRIV